MTRYLIDIRLMGAVKNQIGSLRNRLQEKFRLRNRLSVPHITLAGPFSTTDEERLIADFTRICAGQEEVVRYRLGGFGFFDATRVVCVTVVPDEPLKQFRYTLAQALLPYCTMRDYDRETAEDFRFHATLAMKLDRLTYLRVRWHFRNEKEVVHRPHPVRATLLKNSKILCEYDFAKMKMLSPSQARGRATMVRDRKMTRAYEGEGREE